MLPIALWCLAPGTGAAGVFPWAAGSLRQSRELHSIQLHFAEPFDPQRVGLTQELTRDAGSEISRRRLILPLSGGISFPLAEPPPSPRESNSPLEAPAGSPRRARPPPPSRPLRGLPREGAAPLPDVPCEAAGIGGRQDSFGVPRKLWKLPRKYPRILKHHVFHKNSDASMDSRITSCRFGHFKTIGHPQKPSGESGRQDAFSSPL